MPHISGHPDVASVELLELEQNLATSRDNIKKTKALVEEVGEVVEDVETILDIPENVEKASRTVKQLSNKAASKTDLLKKIGFLRPLAEPLERVLDRVADQMKRIEAKAKQIDDIQAVLRDKNGRAQINLDGSDDVVRLNGVLAAELTGADFILN